MTAAPQALLWDNDGVLVDTEVLYYQANRETLASVDVELGEPEYVEWFLRQGVGAWHLARERGVSEEDVVTLRAARNARYVELLHQGNLVYPNVATSLEQLAQHYRMAIVTTSETDHFSVVHKASGLLGHFELVLTRSDYVSSKPNPEPYLLALQRLGLAADSCLVIEDSERGLQAAVAAGIRCWVVPSHFTRGASFQGAERSFPNISALTQALLQLAAR
jgi:HAD superfamily hydrolase (TIGR01509 family)